MLRLRERQEVGLLPASSCAAADGKRWAEWPTWLLAATIYGGWGALTWHSQSLPWWVVLPLGAFLIAWHNSFQHEAIHGHPTSRDWLNSILALPPLGLWIPYFIYRDAHQRHHRTAALTCPVRDPEAFYVSGDRWRRAGRLSCGLLLVNQSLLGRLTIGPAVAIFQILTTELRQSARDGRRRAIWMAHIAAVGVIALWVVWVCGIPAWRYVLLFAYPGLSLTLLRSFAEHRPAIRNAHRTAVVEGDWLTRLLFLNNNLHAVHHVWPGIPWYRLRHVYLRKKQQVLAHNGGHVYGGYLELARRYLLRPKDLPVHPG